MMLVVVQVEECMKGLEDQGADGSKYCCHCWVYTLGWVKLEEEGLDQCVLSMGDGVASACAGAVVVLIRCGGLRQNVRQKVSGGICVRVFLKWYSVCDGSEVVIVHWVG